MYMVQVNLDEATVRLSKAELVIVNNALNEVCHGIDVPEFATRIGTSIQEVSKLLEDVNRLLGHHVLNQQPLD